MIFKRILLGFLLGGGTLVASAATLLGAGVSPPDEPQGVSLRQETPRAGFFQTYRSHRGGGLRGGK